MNDRMSQDDIDKLLNQDSSQGESSEELASLSSEESDTLGEINNIFMGSASTALSMLLGNKVEITTPKVYEYKNINELITHSEEKVIVEISYIEGLTGTTVLALNSQDTIIIADLMMGGTGLVESSEIGELQLSAVGEAMNQMVGTASTSLSAMLNSTVNISHPNVTLLKEGMTPDICTELANQPIVAVRFNLKVGELIDSEIIQILSVKSAKEQVSIITEMMGAVYSDIDPGNSKSVVDSLMKEKEEAEQQKSKQATASSPPPPQQQVHTQPNFSQPPPQQSYHEHPAQPVTVQPVQFSSFDSIASQNGSVNQNLNLVMDVKLSLTVELGRAELPIKNVLELTRGSIIELEKAAGEPVELYANGKLIAKGEVVVIEDNFGLRITSIISPEHRIKEL